MKRSTRPRLPSTARLPMRDLLKIGIMLDDSLDRPDGVQQYVITTGEWLRAQGHDVHYIVSTTTRRDLPNVHELAGNIGVSFNGNRLCIPLPASRAKIRSFMKREQFDILHVQMPYSPLFAGRVIEAAGPDTAVVGTFHILPKSCFVALASRLLALWCHRTMQRFALTMSVSPAAQTFAKQAFGISSSIVPNGVALNRFQGAEPFKRHAGVRNIVFLGRLVPRKGCMTLLKATVLLRDQADLPPFRVTICGKGPLGERLRQFAKDNGLGRQVVFKGFVAESKKPQYYASADITVFPSIGGESFGIVLIEAMASGRAAVIAGDNPGYRSILESCPESVLFDPHDPHVLAEKLRQLLLDDAQRRHIAKWQAHHAQQYDISRTGPKIIQTYAHALRLQRSQH